MIFGFRFINETKKSCFGRAKFLFGVAQLPSIAWSRTRTKLERTKEGEPCFLKSLFIGSLESSH